MQEAEGWFMCRIGFVETWRAARLVGGSAATRALEEEWPAFGVIEVDQRLVEDAAVLAVARELRSLGSLHLASALVLPSDGLVLATWDRRLHGAAGAEGLEPFPPILA